MNRFKTLDLPCSVSSGMSGLIARFFFIIGQFPKYEEEPI
jgi:hypothetical protein